MLLLLLVACQEPFGVDRHDLVGDRIAAITAEPGPEADQLVARATLVVDGRPWSDAPVDLGWRWVRDGDPQEVARIDPDAPRDGEGPAPVLTWSATRPRLTLIAAFPSGEVRRAFVDVAAVPLTTPSLIVDVDGVVPVPRGDTVTLSARMDPEPEADPLLRWMTIAGVGTFTEVERTRAEWAAAEVVVDDDEVVSRTPVRAGVVTLLALAIDGTGTNAVTARELEVGRAATGIWTAAGRFLPADASFAGGAVRGTLVAHDDAPSGLALTDVVAVDALPAEDPYGTDALGCVDVTGPFEPGWLFDGRCLRSAVAGASVVVVLR